MELIVLRKKRGEKGRGTRWLPKKKGRKEERDDTRDVPTSAGGKGKKRLCAPGKKTNETFIGGTRSSTGKRSVASEPREGREGEGC